ncbi:MAG TPA: methylmalonyl Co-A mutase-associated GTPase MeaB [Actinomycetota bacterium]|nr:methylmalonyl Co-A mutase-associated GTPase MeaB [Actinomycetota bacterium]
MQIGRLVEQVKAGDRRAVARAISMVEDGAAELPALSAGVFPLTGRAHTIGITGPPGVGKSSLANAMVGALRAKDSTVAVLAIDPSSPLSGGALLGDRVRMQEHATDPGVFIRSMATRGHLGGMALAAPEAIRILDASGKDVVIVETVGVGQAEVEVAAATDTTLVVIAPGWGDAVQAAKAGILEVADVFVVNKSDLGDVRDTVRELHQMLRMGEHGAWVPPVVVTSAVAVSGIDDILAAVEEHRRHAAASGSLEERRRRRAIEEVQAMAAARLSREVGELLADPSGDGIAAGLASRRIDPYRATELVLNRAGVRADVNEETGS